MPNVLVEEYYSMHEDLPGIEPFVEYRGDVVLAQSTFESSQGPDVVSADSYLQSGVAGETPPATKRAKASKIADAEVAKVEIPSDPMLDPFDSPLLDDLED